LNKIQIDNFFEKISQKKMTTFKIEQEINTQKFNEEFPIFLTGKVTPNEYQEILIKTNENVKKIRENHQKTNCFIFILTFIYTFSQLLSVTGIVVSITYISNLYIFYGSIILFIFSSLIFGVLMIYGNRHFVNQKTKLFSETKEYVQNENMTKFYFKGVQFLLNLKENRQFYIIPTITVLICDNETTTFIQNQIQNFNQINQNVNSNDNFQKNGYQNGYIY
jgi:hypothetical protein